MKRLIWPIVISLTLLSSACFISCKKQIKTRQDLVAYVNDPQNGLKKMEEIGELKAALTYKPWQLMEYKPLNSGNKSKGDDPYKFKDKLFFVLSLSKKNKELLKQLPFSQYSEMVQVLAFRMKEFITIAADDKKPVEPLDCIFQQTYGMGIANNVLIVFDKKKLLDADELKIQIKEFGLGLGDLVFRMKTKDIKEIQDITIK